MCKSKKGFTLIELLVVVAIIGLLSTLSIVALNNARARARDSRRLADIKQIQTALELYYSDIGLYPATASVTAGSAIASSTTVYMAAVPTAPTPADGTCTAGQNTYTYTQTGTIAGASYTLTYCIGQTTAGITGSSVQTATPAGIH
jgi:general secretion pathway protein G